MLETAREGAGPAGRANSGAFSGFPEVDEGRRPCGASDGRSLIPVDFPCGRLG